MDYVDTGTKLYSGQHLNPDKRIIIQTMLQTSGKRNIGTIAKRFDDPEQQFTMESAGTSLLSITAPSIAVKLKKVKKHTRGTENIPYCATNCRGALILLCRYPRAAQGNENVTR